MRLKTLCSVSLAALAAVSPAYADSILDHLMQGSRGIYVKGLPNAPLGFGVAGVFVDPKNGPVASNDEGATITGLMQAGTSVTAKQINDWAFCNCYPTPVSRDAVRGVAVMPAGSSIDLVNAVAGYTANYASGGVFPVTVALFGVAAQLGNGGSAWGVNTVTVDNTGKVIAGAGTNRSIINIENDNAATSTSTMVTGILQSGVSLVQPGSAGAYTLTTEDDLQGGWGGYAAKWTQNFYTFDGSTTVFAHIGTQAAEFYTNAYGKITFASNPSNGDTITLNGVVVTFVTGTPSTNQVQIQSALELTLKALVDFCNGTANPAAGAASSTITATATYQRTLYSSALGQPEYSLLITSQTSGSGGASYTLAASGATPSGATLTWNPTPNVAGQLVEYAYSGPNKGQQIYQQAQPGGSMNWSSSDSSINNIVMGGMQVVSFPSTTQNTAFLAGLYGTTGALSANLGSQASQYNFTDASATARSLRLAALGGNTPTLSLTGSAGASWLQVQTGINVGGAPGVSCTGTPTSSFQSVGGVVIHC